MPNVLKDCLILALCCCSILLRAQIQKSDTTKKEKVKLIRADALEGASGSGMEQRKLKGNVIFRQGNVTMYCDSAIQYVLTNSLDAFGHVRIEEGKKMTLTGDKVNYDGNSKLAKVKGNVRLKDEKMTLTTDQLNYNMNSKIGYYTTGGKIIDDKNVLTSEKGSYNSNTKFFSFKDSVKLVNKDYTIDCDTMQYNSSTKITYFHGPTNIHTKDGILFAKDGSYNTVTGESDFSRNAAIDNKEYNLTGDSLHYDEKKKVGFAEGNVRLHMKKSGIIVYADYGTFNDKNKTSKSYGHVLMKYAMKTDTMYLKADTLITDQDSAGLKQFDAFYHVRIYKTDMKAKCDSMSYIVSDSIIQYYNDPVLWTDGSQITGEFIEMQMANKQMDKMYVKEKAFMTFSDSLENFNQIKGNDMVAHFDSSNLYRLDVNGNGQSIYYALEGDTSVMGLNQTKCSNMVIKLDSNKVKYINFLSEPEAVFIPPHMINNSDKFLEGFNWRKKEEPKYSEFILKRKPKETSGIPNGPDETELIVVDENGSVQPPSTLPETEPEKSTE